MDSGIKSILKEYAQRFETPNFLHDDPSRFMHQVEGDQNREVTAFIASCLSYGSRKQFMPKIQALLDYANNDMYNWIKQDYYKDSFKEDDKSCFYRLYNFSMMYKLFESLHNLLIEYESIGNFVKRNSADGLSAIKAITSYSAKTGIETIIPKNTTSACKRVCMFLRWMVRDNSPVDIGLWSDFIDKRTLIVPLDTHVLQEANKLHLINNKTASMNVAIKLTGKLRDIFPDDPLKGDFALFGYGVNQ